MLNAVRYLLWLFSRFVLSLRYRIRVEGLDEVRKLPGPILVLPSHPAFIDPPIVMTTFFSTLRPRPFLFEDNFKGLFYPLLTLLDALRVPSLAQASAEAQSRTRQAIEGLVEALHNGQNALLWPSGRVQRTGVERLGAARTLSDVLKAVPEARIVLVRTTGLWGSRFSYGYDGKPPAFVKRLLQGAGLILANLIFFAPRREVLLTLEHVDRSRLPGLDREVLNPWLESWYNKPGPAQPIFVPGHFLFGPRTRDFPRIETEETFDLGKLRDEVRQAVNEMVEDRLKRPIPEAELKPETSLEQLGMDSLDRMELGLSVERRFGFTGDQVPTTLGKLYALASGMLERQPPLPPPPEWFLPLSSNEAEILADTIPEAFVARALACRTEIACVDDLSGPLKYERLLAGALTLARHFRKLPGKNVGLLLPASVGCDVALMGLYLADKLPVVLNWTTGPGNLAHAAKLTNLTQVVTSKAFVDRVGIKVDGTDFVHLEEMRQQVSKWRALWTLLQIRWFPGSIRKAVPRPNLDSPAVILFTSGSEKAPKAVPLTHRNLLINQRGGLAVLRVNRRDSILGFLPAFHSFGMSITGLLPLLAGVRVVRHPDPTDAMALAQKIASYQTTVLVGTPTFVSYILERAEPGALRSLTRVIVGAEKCPGSVFERLRQVAPDAEVLEGYGITECSPVVSVNPPGAARAGTVGKALPGVELCVIDLDTGHVVEEGQQGMLLVGGPTIFPGYIGQESDSPFQQRDGKRWYVTGDLVRIDAEGYIHFSGRLKRFIKAGGEMISLPALEEPFTQRFPPTKEGPRVAVEGIELEGGGRRVVLFTTEDLAVRDANEILQAAGFHGVMRLDEVRHMPALPVLGTGKTDYKILRAQITR